jgi:D-glycero-alpha-D-manno-heptose-7-phosphate kinase
MVRPHALHMSFFGESTDYPVWYREHAEAVPATTIDKCCYLTVRCLRPFFEYLRRISLGPVRLEKTLKTW